MSKLARLFIIGLALLAGNAAAQAPEPAACSLVDGARGYTFGTAVAGSRAAWWCLGADGDWKMHRVVMRAGYTVKHPTEQTTNAVDTFRAYWRANVVFDCARPRSNEPDMLALCDAAYNAGLDTRPLPPFVVRANGTNSTRPTYPLVNGVRGTLSNGTVPIRDVNGRPTACNPAQRLGDYMQVKRTLGTVALCSVP